MIPPDYTDFTVTQLLSRQERDLLAPAARQFEEPSELIEHMSDLFDSDLMEEAGEVVQSRLLLLYYWLNHDMAFADWLLHALGEGGASEAAP